jgi:BASS family bile acid:Na+ symporter
MKGIDEVILNFDSSSLFLLNVILACIMFGIALDLQIDKFSKVLRHPRNLILGLISQLILLPLFTFLLILLLKPIPSMALGMIMVASCPGGNISNFMSSMAGANVELSIVMTVISSLSALIFTPFNFSFYGMLYEPTREILVQVQLDWWDIVKTISLIIILPITLGKLFSHYLPSFAESIKAPFRRVSMLVFILIVVFALAANGNFFMQYIAAIFFIVLFHNALAFTIAFIWGKAFHVDSSSLKSITIETGIQNSGLGLLLIFAFFSGLGGMAVVAAWWGIWHIISGFALSAYFKNRLV